MTQTENKQEIGELDLSGMTLNQSGDEHPITEEMGLSPTQHETEFLENMAQSPVDISHKLPTKDVLEPHRRQLPQRHTRGIPQDLRKEFQSSNCLNVLPKPSVRSQANQVSWLPPRPSGSLKLNSDGLA
ncbi:hypothetical protein LWI28_009705 [Acer negundo]|uniref:Uncharacterized protein n=1 Tax=Acer negundo TaxID=4023 RepID=A0AAD5NWW1_ACENE|nr:hypothetical protein LWI28_009705 [Acer negundo]